MMQQQFGSPTLATPKLKCTPLCCSWHKVPAAVRLQPLCQVLRHQGSSIDSHVAAAYWQPRMVQCHAGFGGFGKAAAAGKSKDCPCGSGRLYSECCQVYHKSSGRAPDTPEQLIRARYSAFVKREFRFLRATSHPDNPALKGSSTAVDAEVQKQCSFEEDMAVTVACLDFVGLEVLGSSTSGSSAWVDVVAHIKRRIDETGRTVKRPAEERWAERAHLVKEPDEGRWLVLSVQQLDEHSGGSSSSSSSTTAAAETAEAVQL